MAPQVGTSGAGERVSGVQTGAVSAEGLLRFFSLAAGVGGRVTAAGGAVLSRRAGAGGWRGAGRSPGSAVLSPCCTGGMAEGSPLPGRAACWVPPRALSRLDSGEVALERRGEGRRRGISC